MLFFFTMMSSVGAFSNGISPGRVLNSYAEPGMDPVWLKEELGLMDWQVVVPVN
jgi:hypothetical protein